jgi:hypothetical protein
MDVERAVTGIPSKLLPGLTRLLIPSALALAGMGCCNHAFAQDWTLSPSISQKVFYDDNLLLNARNKLSTFGSVTTPILKLERKSPTSTIDLTGQFPYSAYFGHSNLNAADQLVNLDAQDALSERSTIAFTGDFQHDTTLRSEQDVTDRFLNKEIRFTRFDASPSWTYLLGPIDQLTLSGSYSEVNYATRTKTDYRYFGPTIAYQHSISELAAITGSLQYNRFEPDDPFHTTTDVYGGLVGYSYKPSERLSVSGSVGMSYNVTKSDVSNDNSLGYRLKFDLNYLMSDQTRMLVSLSHDSEPSGDGRQVTRNRARLGFKYQLNELTTLGLDTNYSDNEDYFGLQNSTNSSNQGLSRYFSVGPSVSFQITEDLSVVAQYQYRHKIFESSSGSATSNGAFLLLRYDLPTLNWGGF